MSVENRPTRTPLVPPGGVDHHVSDMTLTASADLTLQQLQDRLAAHEQWLPIDGDPSLSLGRLIESNSSGPLRLGYGGWRDFLLGAQFETSSGRLITAGGRAIKNVAGYDLTKFMIGQFGLFGRLITITSRAYKRPAGALRVKFPVNDKLVGELLPTAARPQWAMMTRESLFCGYLGDEAAINYYEQTLAQRQPLEISRTTVDEDIAFRAQRWSVRDFRASVPPTRLLEFIQQSKVDGLSADAAFGIIVGACSMEDRKRLGQVATSLGGSITFDDPQAMAEAISQPGPMGTLLRNLKSAFDA